MQWNVTIDYKNKIKQSRKYTSKEFTIAKGRISTFEPWAGIKFIEIWIQKFVIAQQ